MSLLSSKIETFIRRNEKRNKHLYADSLKEGMDYVMCPVTGARLSMIKRNYVEGTLGIPYEDFLRRYPNQLMSSMSRSAAIKRGLSVIDTETGLNKHAISVAKSTQSRAEIGEDGLTVNERKGRRTKSTHLSRVDSNGENGYQRLARKRNETILANGLTVQQNALLKAFETKQKSNAPKMNGASKESKKTLTPLIEYLQENQLKFYFDYNEYGLADESRYYYYDLVIPDYRLVVEYNGKAFHPSPNLRKAERDSWRQVFTNKTAAEVDLADAMKAAAIKTKRGFETVYVYEDTATECISHLLDILRNGPPSGDGFIENTEWEILTPQGWKNFKGTIDKGVADLVQIKFEDGNSVEATENHEFFVNGERIKAADLLIGSFIDGYQSQIVEVCFAGESVVYDLVEVSNEQHSFYVNGGVLTKNCDEFAFVQNNIQDAFWTANLPVLSTGGSCIITSTPKSDVDRFAQIYFDAINTKDEWGNENESRLGANGFYALTYKWDVHPDRDAAWENEFRSKLGDQRFEQEMACCAHNTTIKLNKMGTKINTAIGDLFHDLKAGKQII